MMFLDKSDTLHLNRLAAVSSVAFLELKNAKGSSELTMIGSCSVMSLKELLSMLFLKSLL